MAELLVQGECPSRWLQYEPVRSLMKNSKCTFSYPTNSRVALPRLAFYLSWGCGAFCLCLHHSAKVGRAMLVHMPAKVRRLDHISSEGHRSAQVTWFVLQLLVPPCLFCLWCCLFTRCVAGLQSGAAESKTKPGFLKNVIKEYISHDNKTSVAFAFAFALFLLLFKFSKRLENLIFIETIGNTNKLYYNNTLPV